MAIQKKTIWAGPIAAPLFVAVLGMLAGAAPLWAQSHGRLSESLRKHVASKSTQKISVIVHGGADQIDALAAGQHLTIKKRLSEGAVFQASAAEIESLAAKVDHLSRDIEVSSFMSVTDPAIGADQVWAGWQALTFQ